MPQTIEQDGKTIEVFTADEIKAQQETAIKAATEPLQAKLTEAEDKLKGISDKDQNFAQLRETHTKEIDQLKNQITEETNKVRTEFQQKELTATTNAAIAKLAEGDTELEKKIRGHLETTLKDMKATTPEETANKIRAAYQLATANEPKPGLLDGVLSSAGAGAPPVSPDAGPALSPELGALTKRTAAAGGIQLSDDDLKTYNKKVDEKYKLNSYGK